MNRKMVSAITFTLLLAGTLTLAFNIQSAKASGTVYIRADGSIDPQTAPISTVDNVTYVFTGDINDSIVIERDNIVVDGALYIVEGAGSGIGITLSGRTNVTIKNMTIKAFGGTSISLSNSAGNSISGNDITNNVRGIVLDSSSNNVLSGNNVTNNQYGIELSISSNNLIFHNNFVDNTNQVSIMFSSVNIWDDGSRGNYWSDYLTKYPNATEIDSSGVWNIPYIINMNDADHYPLMNLWVRLPGDINSDGIVDIYDAILLANAYNSTPGKANWNPNADINGDNIVDIYDAILLASHYNQHYA